MGALSNAFWLWLPILLYKGISALLRTIWKFNLWILQTICGVPLYYCKPNYRIPAIFIGTVGIMAVFNFIVFFLIMNLEPGDSVSHMNSMSQLRRPLNEILEMGGMGLGLLFLCRVLIRKGSI